MEAAETPPPGGGAPALFLHNGAGSSSSREEGGMSTSRQNRNQQGHTYRGGGSRRGANFSRGRQAQFDDNRRPFVGGGGHHPPPPEEDYWRGHEGQGPPPRSRRGHNRGGQQGQWTPPPSQQHQQSNNRNRNHHPSPQHSMDSSSGAVAPSSNSTLVANGGAAILAALSNALSTNSTQPPPPTTNPFSVSSSLNPNAPSFQPSSRKSTSKRGGPSDRNFDNLRRLSPEVEEVNKVTTPPAVVFRVKKKPEATNQRENLMEQLERNAYDCMICVERVKRFHPVWSCAKCFNVFHLTCLRKWANSSADEVGWRCPGCQSYSEEIPSTYFCFCGALKNPPGNLSDIPHTCGRTCGKPLLRGPQEDCPHFCGIPCHPGPCPPCDAVVTRRCPCGRTEAQVKCSSKGQLTCTNVCDKPLTCMSHLCTRICHTGNCEPCDLKIQLGCFCGGQSKEVVCSLETLGVTGFSCGDLCGKALTCGNHTCPELCHAGICRPCRNSPDVVLSCPCGQTPISEACRGRGLPPRTSCVDEIPTCTKVCRKILPCGGEEGGHRCEGACHLGSCPSCKLKSTKKCRCGNKTFSFPCASFNPREDVLCERKCAKKRNCGKHKCNVKCCIDADHLCPIVCDRPLRCGNHNCALLCHNGHCPPCRNVSFEELTCECGDKVIYPPVPCGTRPPPCTSPCPRQHACNHPVLHHCHSDPQCPPCTVLTEKWCNGRHELRKNVMCHIGALSCGMPCRKRLPCGRHLCVKTCHANVCLAPNEVCVLPCDTLKSCGHKCGAPCHEGPCPDVKCKLNTDVTCPCGRRKDVMICWKREKEYDRNVTYLMNLELKRLREAALNDDNVDVDVNTEINPETILAEIKESTPKVAVLECDKECARVERNRKLVEALQVNDFDVTSTFGTPNYSDFLVTFTKKNPQFVEMVHQRLTSIVVRSKTSKKKNETFAFESMNRDKRTLIHEYSDHFGVLSESFDVEPNRNVMVTASKEKSYIPQVSLVDFVFRPSVKSERKNVFEDVELVPNSKSTIFRPSNGKIGTATSNSSTATSTSGMVKLSTPIPSAWGSSTASASARAPASAAATTSLGGGSDFPALQ